MATPNAPTAELAPTGRVSMRSVHLYEIKMLDGTTYKGEIAYRDERTVVVKTRNAGEHGGGSTARVQLFHPGILAITEIGWQHVACQ